MMSVSGGQALPNHGGFALKDPVDGRGQKHGSHGASPNPSMCWQRSGAEAAQVLGRWIVWTRGACPARAVSVSPLIKKKLVSREARQAYFISTKSIRWKVLQDCLYGKTYTHYRSNFTNRIKKPNTLHKKRQMIYK